MYKLYSSGTKLFLFSNIYNDTTSVLFKENVSSLVSKFIWVGFGHTRSQQARGPTSQAMAGRVGIVSIVR